MEKVNVKFENCYGIKKLEQEFDFTKKHAFIIYASNGTMKTSFTKTMKNISNEIPPKEEVYGRKSIYSLKDETGKNIKADEIFVIESYDENFYSEKCQIY